MNNHVTRKNERHSQYYNKIKYEWPKWKQSQILQAKSIVYSKIILFPNSKKKTKTNKQKTKTNKQIILV